MKFQVLFFAVVLVVVATFFTTKSDAAPSKSQKHGENHVDASKIEFLTTTTQLRHFLHNGKRHEQKIPKAVAPKLKRNAHNHVHSMTRAIENPGLLLQLVNYLTWLSDLNIQDTLQKIYDFIEDPVAAFWNFSEYLYEALETVGVDTLALQEDYIRSIEDDYFPFWNQSMIFWKNWIDDPEHIRENLLIYIPQVQQYLLAYGTKTQNYLINLVNLSQTLLTPEALQKVLNDVQAFLDESAAAFDKLRTILSPPSEISRPPTNLTLEGVIGFFPYIAELNVSAVLLDGLSTAKELQDIRRGFNDDLVAILGEASTDGADLETQGRDLTSSFEESVAVRYGLNRLAFDNLVYTWFYSPNLWEFIFAINELLDAWTAGLYQIPKRSVETIVQLAGLVETTAPEYQQRASELVTQALQKSDAVIKTYLQVFKPKEMKN